VVLNLSLSLTCTGTPSTVAAAPPDAWRTPAATLAAIAVPRCCCRRRRCAVRRAGSMVLEARGEIDAGERVALVYVRMRARGRGFVEEEQRE